MHARREDRAAHGASRDDDPGAHHRVHRRPDPALLLEDELRRRQLLGPGQDRPVLVVEVEHRVDRDQIHVRVVVRVERPHVAPVAEVALARAEDLAVGEVPHAGLPSLDEVGDDVAADVVRRGLVGGVADDGVDQHVGREHVVPHRREHLAGRLRHPDRVARLLAERPDRARVGVGLDHAELAGALDRDPDPRDREPGSERDVLLEHLARIHPEDVVGAEDADVVGPLVVDQVQVLVDRVGRAGEPVRPAAHLGGHRRDVVAEQRRQPPGGRDVAAEALALVLRQHRDLELAGVDEVREREVDQPVVAAEGHRRLRPVGGQRRQALSLTTGEDDREDPGRSHAPQRIAQDAIASYRRAGSRRAAARSRA